MGSRRIDPKSLPQDSTLAAIVGWRAELCGERVSIVHDGRELPAIEGEPLAICLLANGVTKLARSVKFHRPRGPSCLRAACDGCLTRIDGVPNVMACRAPAHAGARVESQNAFPNASLDVLRVTDWFFPRKFDHHHLMVDYGGALNRAMQVFARRMAGMGTLPDADAPIAEPEHAECDVLVVGTGPAGLATAAELASVGLRVLAVEEEENVGGTLLDDLEPVDGGGHQRVLGYELAAVLGEAASRAGAQIRTGASAVASYDDLTLVTLADRVLMVRPRVRIFANGGHEMVGTFESNDLPGVYTARAAARALAHGVVVGERVVVAGTVWPAKQVDSALRTAGSHVVRIERAALLSAMGREKVQRVRIADPSGETHQVACDALIVADAPTPAYELLGQAGVAIDPDPDRECFVPRCARNGSTERSDVWATGCVRAGFDPASGVDAALQDGRRTAQAAIARLQHSSRNDARESERVP